MCRRIRDFVAHIAPTLVAKAVRLSGFGSFAGMGYLEDSLFCADACICVVLLIGVIPCRTNADFTTSKVFATSVVIYHAILVVIFQASIFAHPLATAPVVIGQLEASRVTIKNNMSIFHQVSVAKKEGTSELFKNSAA